MDIVFFSTLVNKELHLRGLPGVGNLAERQSRLRAHLLIEQRLERIKEAIERTREGKEAALILIKQAVPCIMHTENWVGEKIATVLSAIGAAEYQSDRGSDNLDLYAQRVEEVVQTRILGTIHRPKLWRFPLKENRKEVAKVALSNKKTRQFINNIDVLIDVVFHKPEHAGRRDIWRNMMEQYRLAMRILRKRSEYTDDEIILFQDLIDDFFLAYIQETGNEGITNYLHMLGSGHMKYYMEIHRNLYKFSQQGWESLNSKYKQIFFRHTQRGGHYGRESGESERHYLLSVMKAFQREMLWISGEADNYFTNLKL